MWKQHHRIKKENKAKKNGNGTDKKTKTNKKRQ